MILDELQNKGSTMEKTSTNDKIKDSPQKKTEKTPAKAIQEDPGRQ